MLRNIDFKSGKITSENLLWIKDDNLVKQEQDFLGQDLLQVKYFEHYMLDVGWYNKSDKKGTFTILCIINQNWEKPLFKTNALKLKDLKKQIEIGIKVI